LSPVLYNLYFLPPQFHFLSNLIPVVYEKTGMVPPSNFSSKTNVHPRHHTGVGVHARHLSPWYTSALTWLLFFFIIILMISFIYIKFRGGRNHPHLAWPPQQFFFFFFKKIFKIIYIYGTKYIDFILFYFLTYSHKKRKEDSN
jgi:hypothetical protein